MERVGQRWIAWEAYVRAVSLADRFWGDEATRAALVAHCRSRQDAILAVLRQREPLLTAAELQRRFDLELAFGVGCQRDQQAEEAQRLAAGADPDAVDLAAAVASLHPDLATRPGDEDTILLRGRRLGSLDLTGLFIGIFIGIALVVIHDAVVRVRATAQN